MLICSGKMLVNYQEVDTIIKALANPVRTGNFVLAENPAPEFPEQTSPYTDGVCVDRSFRGQVYRNQPISAHLATLQRAGLLTSSDWGGGCITSAMKP